MEQKLETVLSELASKLGTSVDKLYALTIKQAKIEIIGKIITGIMFICLVIGLIFFSTYLATKKWQTGGPYSDITGWGILVIFTGFALVAIILIFVSEFGNYCKNLATLITNPEYWAIQDILASIPME